MAMTTWLWHRWAPDKPPPPPAEKITLTLDGLPEQYLPINLS